MFQLRRDTRIKRMVTTWVWSKRVEDWTNRCNSSSRFRWYSSVMLQVLWNRATEPWLKIFQKMRANVRNKINEITRGNDIRPYTIITNGWVGEKKIICKIRSFSFCVQIVNAATSKQMKVEVCCVRWRQRCCFYYDANFRRMRGIIQWILTVRDLSIDSWVAHVVVFSLAKRNRALTSPKVAIF